MVATALKKVQHQKQNMLTPQNQAKQTVSVIPFQWCIIWNGSFIFSWQKTVLWPEIEQNVHFLGAVKLHCLCSHYSYFLKFFDHGITPGCSEMLRPSALR